MKAVEVVETLKQRFPNEPEYIQAVSYISSVNADIADLSSKMEKVQTILQSIKIGVRPNDCFVNIQPQIIL